MRLREGRAWRSRPVRAAAVAALTAAAGMAVWAAIPAFGTAGGETAPGWQEFMVKVNVGDARSCTGVLLTPQFALTSRECFEPGGTPVAEGPPSVPSTVVARPDAEGTDHAGAIDYVTPRTDRNLALVHIDIPIETNGGFPSLATSAPVAGEVLRVYGYGRTGDEWVPDLPHTAAFSVQSTSDTMFDIAGVDTGSICKGDAGGPVVREISGSEILVGLNNTSWQGGCLGETSTNRAATATRVDDITGWITQRITLAPPASVFDNGGDANESVRWVDFNGDGRADYLRPIQTNGTPPTVRVLLNGGGDAHGGWTDLADVTLPAAADPALVRFADWDGDGRDDYIVLTGGAATVYLNNATGGWTSLGQVTSGFTTDASRVRFADFTGDGRADYIVVAATGAVTVTQNSGGDGHGGWASLGQVTPGTTADISKVRFADFDGDGKADYVVVTSDTGAATVQLNKGGDGHGGWQNLGQVTTGIPSPSPSPSPTGQTRPPYPPFAVPVALLPDTDGDGRADLLLVDRNGQEHLLLNRGGDGQGGWLPYGDIITGRTPIVAIPPSPGPRPSGQPIPPSYRPRPSVFPSPSNP